MAVLTDGPGAGRGADRIGPALTARLGRMTHYAGAAMSVALLAGVSIWGYKLIMRDVNGIPVVRAMEGPMRVAPEDPGGEVAAHTGLAVNAIAAVGEAAPPEDMLMLAPQPGGLAPEDMEVALAGEEADMTPLAEAADADIAAGDPPVMTQDEVLALADRIAAGADPLSDLAPGTDTPVEVSVEGEAVTDEARFTIIPADVPGVAVAIRPPSRPATAEAVAAALANLAPAAAETAPAVSGPVPAGTPIVQFGAYESVEIAAREWDRLNGRFGEFLAGKTRVIQEAASGGHGFFRLRATGFADMADARRFCAALVAENAECIPTVEQ